MIYFNGKKWGKSLESLLDTKNIGEVEDREKLEKLISKGETIYCSINPYSEAMKDFDNQPSNLIWDTDESELSERCSLLSEEI